MGGISAAPTAGATKSGITNLVGTVLSSALAPSPPSPAAPPPMPELAPPPPPPTVSTAADVSPEAVVDTEAARVRSAKRRKAATETNLFNLTSSDSEAVSLTKSLLGE